MRCLLAVIIASLLAGNSQQMMGQAKRQDCVAQKQYISDVKEEPSLGIEYQGVAKFKLASRKTTYRLGEIISLDMAMMNTANVKLFFEKPTGIDLTIKVVDEYGKEVTVSTYVIIAGSPDAESYSLLEPNRIVIGSYQLLAGCNTQGVTEFLDAQLKLAQDVSQRRVEYHQGLFERGLFVNWGDACLRNIQPGRYTVTATMTNKWVVIPPDEKRVKTAVGTIHSTPLTITITE